MYINKTLLEKSLYKSFVGQHKSFYISLVEKSDHISGVKKIEMLEKFRGHKKFRGDKDFLEAIIDV